MVRQPELFLFDEPLSNLEAGLRSQLQSEIRRLLARLGATAVYVTHDQTEAMTVGQRVAVLGGGRLQQVADPLTLYRRPANRFVAGLIGMPPMNFLAGRIEPDGAALCFVVPGGGDLAAPAASRCRSPPARRAGLAAHVGRPVLLGVRPEHLAATAAAPAAEAPRLAATVEAVERLGPLSHVYLRAGPHALVAQMEAACPLSVGDPLTLLVAMDEAHFFDAQTEQAIA